MGETKETKTYTQEEVEKDFVKKEEFDKLFAEYKKVASAFNTLLKEFNDLHLTHLLSSAE